MTFFAEALQSDVSYSQHGTAAEGVHLGAMAGTFDQVVRVSTGIEATGDILRLNPETPPEMKSLALHSALVGIRSNCISRATPLTVRGEDLDVAPISLSVAGKTCEFLSGTTRVFQLNVAASATPGYPKR
jgi:trehalose/maltose hydrolase-like predicted phosphorylase